MNTESEVSKVLVDSLIAIENVILEKYKPPKDAAAKQDYDIDHSAEYDPILYQIKNAKNKIDSINLKNVNDELERLDKDYNKSLNNDIKQNIKNIGFNLLWIVFCIILIILISIDSPVSYWFLGILLFGNCLMLFINSVKYFNNKFYKSQLDKHKKAAGEGYGKFYNKIGDNNGIENAAPLIEKFINTHKMINTNPVFDTFRKNVNDQYNDQYNDQNNLSK